MLIADLLLKNMTKYYLPFVFLLSLLLSINYVHAATVDTAVTYSASMKKNIKAVVIMPDKYSKNTAYPVVYLLHGYSGNYAGWITKAPAIKNLADQYNLMIVCPDGNFGSWYLDSPVDPAWRY